MVSASKIEKVPFFSANQTFRGIEKNLKDDLKRVVSSKTYIDGEFTHELENKICAYTGSKHAIALGNATDALIILLRAAGIGKGDEVIIPCFSFAATLSCILINGAKPVFVDIDRDTYNMCPKSLSQAITKRTKAIMPVHLFLQLANMHEICQIASKNEIMILEDSAEAIGMYRGGIHGGLFGKGGVLSFFPTKTLGAFGDAGMIITNDQRIASLSRTLKESSLPNNIRGWQGFESHMDEVQACLLLSGLGRLENEVNKRAYLAERYTKKLEKCKGVLKTPCIKDLEISRPVYYVYAIEVEERDQLLIYLKQHGIEFEQYYPIPLYRQPFLETLESVSYNCPNAEQVCRHTVGLPMYPDLSEDQVDYICEVIIVSSGDG